MTTDLTEHEPGTSVCRPDLHCYSCNKDEEVPPSGAFMVCPECFHIYEHPDDLKKAYLARAWQIFKHDMRQGRRIPAAIATIDGQSFEFTPWKPPRFIRILAVWLLIRSVFRDPADISFCQECLHDF